MNNPPIYLDYNATTPVDKRVLDVMIPYFSEKFGNASSNQHFYGWDAEEAVEEAREQVASLISARPNEIIFTSGATESINAALIGAYESIKSNKNHLITCKTEHKAVLDTCSHLEKKGAKITYLDVDESGMIDLNDLESGITDRTGLIVLMHANNETGVIHPIDKIAELGFKYGIPVFSDATQSVGKITCDVHSMGVDFMAFSGHKMYGPKGVGALYINGRSETKIAPGQFGGGHERGYRSGTLNVPGIVGFGKACELSGLEMQSEKDRLGELRDTLESELLRIGATKINGRNAPRLPHVSNLSFKHIDGSRLIRALKGLAVSQGSACNSAVIQPSHVLKAMGHEDSLAYASIRVSLGRFTGKEEIPKSLNIIGEAIKDLRLQLQ